MAKLISRDDQKHGLPLKIIFLRLVAYGLLEIDEAL
jgi:hypothetical protein